MTIEEKARRYDEAIERAKSKIKNNKDHVLYENDIIEMFPELTELEDERIRKEIISALKYANYKGVYDKHIAWLEKQGEQKSKKVSLWKHWKDGIAGNGEGKIIYLVKMDNTYRLTSCLGFECDYIELSELDNLLLEKQGGQKPAFEMKTPEESLGIDSDTYNKIVDECIYGEQKPADVEEVDFFDDFRKTDSEVEPKFKVGDWVVQENIGTYKVVEVCESWYEVIDSQNNHYSIGFDKEYMCHLWIIQDAKDGDVLAAHECYVIFKEIDGLNIKCYCTYHYMGCNPKFYVDTLQNKNAFYPSTKEQRNTLMKAMADAGYTFDFEKKELKKIEQKPAWSEEDETTKNNISHIIRQYDKISKRENQPCYYVGDCLLWMQNIKDRVQPQPKKDWKQENTGDLTEFENAMMCVGESFFGKYAGLDPNDTNAIKGQANLLLELVPKQEWSEEEKARIDKIVDVLDWAEEKGYIHYSDWEDYICYVKSLRPQNTWKPSDEQMTQLKKYCPDNTALTALYEQLKKIKG